jgi:hypothetical protein
MSKPALHAAKGGAPGLVEIDMARAQDPALPVPIDGSLLLIVDCSGVGRAVSDQVISQARHC